jgi:hypothetical protein
MEKLAAWMVLIVLIVLVAAPQRIQASPRINIMACRDVSIQDLGPQGTRVTPTGCAREFSVSAPYIVLFFEVIDIETQGQFSWELLDPAESPVATFTRRIDPRGGYRWTYYFYAVLPVAMSADEIVRQNPRLRYNIVDVARSVKDAPGEWKLRVSLDRLTATGRFVLKP